MFMQQNKVRKRVLLKLPDSYDNITVTSYNRYIFLNNFSLRVTQTQNRITLSRLLVTENMQFL
jgi:hypothetical protein